MEMSLTKILNAIRKKDLSGKMVSLVKSGVLEGHTNEDFL